MWFKRKKTEESVKNANTKHSFAWVGQRQPDPENKVFQEELVSGLFKLPNVVWQRGYLSNGFFKPSDTSEGFIARTDGGLHVQISEVGLKS